MIPLTRFISFSDFLATCYHVIFNSLKLSFKPFVGKDLFALLIVLLASRIVANNGVQKYLLCEWTNCVKKKKSPLKRLKEKYLGDKIAGLVVFLFFFYVFFMLFTGSQIFYIEYILIGGNANYLN